MSIEITKNEDTIAVNSPYAREFVSGAKALGGRWDSAARVWTFDARDEDRVRDLCMEIYGEDGRSAEVGDVTVRMVLEMAYEPEIRAAGRTLVRRRYRDDDVILGDDVVVIEGSFPSRGGSRKNPAVGDCDGVVIEVRDLPMSVAEKMISEVDDYDVEGAKVGGSSIVDADAKKRAALEEKIARLREELVAATEELASMS